MSKRTTNRLKIVNEAIDQQEIKHGNFYRAYRSIILPDYATTPEALAANLSSEDLFMSVAYHWRMANLARRYFRRKLSRCGFDWKKIGPREPSEKLGEDASPQEVLKFTQLTGDYLKKMYPVLPRQTLMECLDDALLYYVAKDVCETLKLAAKAANAKNVATIPYMLSAVYNYFSDRLPKTMALALGLLQDEAGIGLLTAYLTAGIDLNLKHSFLRPLLHREHGNAQAGLQTELELEAAAILLPPVQAVENGQDVPPLSYTNRKDKPVTSLDGITRALANDLRRHLTGVPITEAIEERAIAQQNEAKSPAQQLEDKLQREELWTQAQTCLASKEFLTLQMFYGEHMSYEEIAEERGVTVSTVGNTLTRCIVKMQNANNLSPKPRRKK